MNRVSALLAVTLVIASCGQPEIQKVPSDSGVGVSHHPNSAQDNLLYLSRLRHLRENREASHRSDYSVSSKNSYKGISHYRNIDDYSDKELLEYNQDELTIVVDNPKYIKYVVDRLVHQGYKVGRANFDTITIKIPERGASGIRRHFKHIENQDNVKIVAPRRGFDVPGQAGRYSLQNFSPNDPLLGSQWGLDKILANVAWSNYSIRASFGVIAVLSSGVNKNHPDLKDRLMLGYNTTPTWSYEFTTYSVDGYNYDVNDQWGQGTFVSGVAAAQFNNGIGISGSAGGAHIMPMVVTEYSTGSGHRAYGDNARYAAKLAIEAGANVLLCPFNVLEDWFFQDMVRIAEEAGVPVIAPRSTNQDKYGSFENPFYGKWPAEYPNPNVISVGSINPNEILDDDDNNSYTYVMASNYADFVAPGTNILGTKIDGTYGSSTGLYNATHVAAALVAGAYSSLQNACRAFPLSQITDAFLATSRDLGVSGYDTYYGHGLINFGAAANLLLSSGLVYRWVNESNNVHDWTTNTTVKLGGLFEGVRFALKPTNVPGTVPLYRKVPTGAKNDVLLTTDVNEAYHLGYQVNNGNNQAVPIGYISLTPGAAPGMTKALYRLWKAGEGHFYTTDSAERDRCTNLWGWTYEGITGYTW